MKIYESWFHLQVNSANKACFFIKVVIIRSTRFNCFFMGSSYNRNPVSSFSFILSNLVCFLANTSPRQYLTALSLNTCLLCLSIGVSSFSGTSKLYPQCFSHLATVLYIEDLIIYLGGVVLLYLILSRSLSLF